jgi:hypothetical protein
MPLTMRPTGLGWSLTINGPMTRADKVATLEEAKAQFQKSWDAWNSSPKMEEHRANDDNLLR